MNNTDSDNTLDQSEHLDRLGQAKIFMSAFGSDEDTVPGTYENTVSSGEESINEPEEDDPSQSKKRKKFPRSWKGAGNVTYPMSFNKQHFVGITEVLDRLKENLAQTPGQKRKLSQREVSYYLANVVRLDDSARACHNEVAMGLTGRAYTSFVRGFNETYNQKDPSTIYMPPSVFTVDSDYEDSE